MSSEEQKTTQETEEKIEKQLDEKIKQKTDEQTEQSSEEEEAIVQQAVSFEDLAKLKYEENYDSFMESVSKIDKTLLDEIKTLNSFSQVRLLSKYYNNSNSISNNSTSTNSNVIKSTSINTKKTAFKPVNKFLSNSSNQTSQTPLELLRELKTF